MPTTTTFCVSLSEEKTTERRWLDGKADDDGCDQEHQGSVSCCLFLSSLVRSLLQEACQLKRISLPPLFASLALPCHVDGSALDLVTTSHFSPLTTVNRIPAVLVASLYQFPGFASTSFLTTRSHDALPRLPCSAGPCTRRRTLYTTERL